MRRLMLAIGAALLVGGWGTTRYADEQQQAAITGYRWEIRLWISGRSRSEQLIPSRVIYGAGVIGMAIGAGLIGFAVLRPTKPNDE